MTDYLKLANEHFAWPGGYEIFFITDDGGILCSPCVVKEWDECIEDADIGDGWNVTAYSHTGNIDEAENCDHCYRTISP